MFEIGYGFTGFFYVWNMGSYFINPLCGRIGNINKGGIDGNHEDRSSIH